MAIHVALRHRTHYTYDKPVAHSPHVVRLRPAPHCRTPILSYSQRVEGKHFINWQQDPFANWNARIVFPDKLGEFCVEVELVAEMAVYNAFDFFLEEDAEHYPFAYEAVLKKDLAPFLEPGQLTPKFTAYLDAARKDFAGKPNLRTIDFLIGINQRLQRDIRYLIRMEHGVQTPEETLTTLSGSCRDSAWLLCELLRHSGLAARFVSGYLIQLAADVKALDGPSGTDVDFTDLHAWCEVYLPGAGWIGLDPTSGLLASEGHIPLSCTPEPATAAPITGMTDPCVSTLRHEMHISRIYESPRVTKPYTEKQWENIQTLGQRVDADLVKHDVRLTMGGEPTFVSIDDFDSAEWNTAALGPSKRALSEKLIRRMQRHFAPGALLHCGQGKAYPGEVLPRWAFGCYWRKDGEPIWQNHELIADEQTEYAHTAEDSGKFIAVLAVHLGVDACWILPAHEDYFQHAWQEKRMPVNAKPTKNLTPPGIIIGHALPLQRSTQSKAPGWLSGPWFLRSERLQLFPGDSPMGLRLPLDSLPWVSPEDYPYITPLDPTIPREPLPKRDAFCKKYGPSPADTAREPKAGESASWIVRTAICVEARGGKLHVFMPPLALLEEYLELVVAIEDTATELQLPVVIEGYTPPFDPRIEVLKITPDPGVIEVNLHPSRTWDELVSRTTLLYEEARQTRLGTEKFMMDGRHTGTGGGNHIILGGATPTDSPILRRPDLLRSLLTYWQNHPALSFLFSSLSIGPTSQSPRVDEARNDSLYELGVAFKEMDRQSRLATEKHPKPTDDEKLSYASGHITPWLVDRLFRNLLIDSTGNTHRAEFCIDKLYSPDSSTGRLGLLEMRAFEMPPHARMSLAQHLLLRALVAKFWREPYTNPLIHWGTDLHDRWMLPHFCQTDFRDVIEDLREAGYALEFEWFAPHFEFRFPRIGEFAQREVLVELRTALEPWHVLGEESAAGGTVRYMDTSLERLQVKVRGLCGERFALVVNGRRVPLHPTGTAGEGVAGVRYRAWQPPSCLQPTIPPHAPLTFDLYDTWNGRSIGGCTYHVAHPGGRNYDAFPVNSYEAESRRLSRFAVQGHKQGKFAAPPTNLNAHFPFTLDLRY